MRHVRSDMILVGISELRTQADEIVKASQRAPVILGKRHKPIAVLVPMEQYDRTEEILEAIEDTVLGLLAQERERRTPRKGYLTLEALEQRVGLRHQ